MELLAQGHTVLLAEKNQPINNVSNRSRYILLLVYGNEGSNSSLTG